MSTFLKPGYVRWDGTKYVTDPDIEIVGPQGLPGPTGLQGPRGKTGATGPVGPSGKNGKDGKTGPQGPQGISGAQGSNSGFTGPTGPTGPKGSQGVQGIQGIQGPIGSQGIQGSIGVKGDQGLQGFTGIQGSTGYTGPQGFIGYTGPTGPTGATGDSRISFSAELESGLTVLNLVCVSSTASTSIKVGKADANDETKMPAIGVLISKESETIGTIVSSTILELSGLVPGSIYFVGESGEITNTPPSPTTGSVFVQQIGVALTNTLLLINLVPNYTERVV